MKRNILIPWLFSVLTLAFVAAAQPVTRLLLLE
jgi:hypothetical protein